MGSSLVQIQAAFMPCDFHVLRVSPAHSSGKRCVQTPLLPQKVIYSIWGTKTDPCFYLVISTRRSHEAFDPLLHGNCPVLAR